MIKNIALSALLTFLLASTPCLAAGQPFEQWLNKFRIQALQEGISQHTVDTALYGLQPDDRVLRLDRKQPEGTKTFASYRASVVNQKRIAKGRELMALHADTLARISDQTGVAPQYIVALWGIETSFGSNTGGFDIVPSLATLAWEGRREAFFRKELLDALRILDQGDIDLPNFRGSWAGAMGQNQFMPSSFLKFAADGDNDGKRDIWKNPADVFASTANYLAQSGWRSGERWGREVRVPKGFDAGLVKSKTEKSLAEWSRLGVKLPDGGILPPDENIRASLVAPDGIHGPTYLAYDNYRVIMKWNRSTYFATSVGLLANAIAGPQ